MLPKRHLTSTVVAVAGCSPVTFRAWRNRNGLFPETQGTDGWNVFSEGEIAAVRMVVVLTGLGIGAQVAVDAAMQALPTFKKLYEQAIRGDAENLTPIPLVAVIDRTEDEPDPSILMVHAGDSVGSVLRRVAYGTAVMVNLLEIAEHVSEELKSGHYPTLMTGNETLRLLAKTMADVLDPEKNPPKYDEQSELSGERKSKPRPHGKSRPRKGRRK